MDIRNWQNSAPGTRFVFTRQVTAL